IIMLTVWIIVGLYLLAMIGVGFYYKDAASKSADDFLVAGRRLGPFMVAGTLAATQVGGGSTMGVAQNAYGTWGLSSAWYIICMSIAFVIIAYVAPHLRRSQEKTVPEYFRWRYGKGSGLLTSIIMIPPEIGDAVVQFTATGILMSVLTGWSFMFCLILSTLVILLYAYIGGLYSVTMTDVIQWVIIVIGLIVCIPFALHAVGGWNVVVTNVPKASLDPIKGIGWGTIVSLIIMYVASFLVGQETIQKIYSCRDEKVAKQASLLCSGMYLFFAFIPAILGLICLAAVNTGVISGAAIEANGTRYVLPTLGMVVLPKVILGFLAAALASATMSSASSDLLGAASMWANDIYKQYVNKNATDKDIVNQAKWSLLVFGLIGLLIATMNIENLITLLMFCFTLKSAGTIFPYVVGHFWDRASKAGSYLSIICASAVVIPMENFGIKFFSLEPIIPGLIVGLIAFLIGSYLFPDKEFPGTMNEELGN
ncbi:MAG: sodium:solute symporter family protein, partial [Syntrophomonas sp.]